MGRCKRLGSVAQTVPQGHDCTRLALEHGVDRKGVKLERREEVEGGCRGEHRRVAQTEGRQTQDPKPANRR